MLQDCYELGVILLRKKLYTQATKNLDRARKAWTGPQNELAQVCMSTRQQNAAEPLQCDTSLVQLP